MAFIKSSKNMQDVLKSFEEYIREKKNNGFDSTFSFYRDVY